MAFPSIQFDDVAQKARFDELVAEIERSGKPSSAQKAALDQLFSAAQAVDVLVPNGRIDNAEGKVLLGAIDNYRANLDTPLSSNYGAHSYIVPSHYATTTFLGGGRRRDVVGSRTVTHPDLVAAAKARADEAASVAAIHREATAAIK